MNIKQGGAHKRLFWRILFFAALCAALLWIYAHLAEAGFAYEWHWNRVWRHFGRMTPHGFVAGPLLKGLLLTIGIAALGLILSALLGLCLALMRFCGRPLYALAALAHITVFRNTPLLLQLFFIYFLVAPLFGLGPFGAAIMAITAFEGAYFAEIIRAGLTSVPREQWEGAFSLGFGFRQTLWLLILPQALRGVLPALTNQAVSLIKDTSLVSAIAVADLTLQAQAIIAETFLVFEVWLLVAAIYLALTLCLSLPAIRMESRFPQH